jgi:hypothetical protein
LKKKNALKTYRRKLENEYELGRGESLVPSGERISFQQQINGRLCAGLLSGWTMSKASEPFGVRARLQRT